jgi:hypothetical protein
VGLHSLHWQLGTMGQDTFGEALRDVVGSRIYGRGPAQLPSLQVSAALILVVVVVVVVLVMLMVDGCGLLVVGSGGDKRKQ